MSTTAWLREQVERLAAEIRDSTIFDDQSVPSPEELAALRRKVVMHRYLLQQLQSRRAPEPASSAAQEPAIPRRE